MPPSSSGRPRCTPSFRTEQADFLFRIRSCECVGLRRETSAPSRAFCVMKSLFSPPHTAQFSTFNPCTLHQNHEGMRHPKAPADRGSTTRPNESLPNVLRVREASWLTAAIRRGSISPNSWGGPCRGIGVTATARSRVEVMQWQQTRNRANFRLVSPLVDCW